jgi:hypothetical protein
LIWKAGRTKPENLKWLSKIRNLHTHFLTPSMTSNFSRQIEPCPRNGLYVRSLPAPKGNSAPPIPRATYDQSAPDGKLDHKTQAAFLKALIAYEAGEASLRLRESLAKADRERKRIGHALFLMVALFILEHFLFR